MSQPPDSRDRIAVVVGNPSPASRTRAVAEHLAARLGIHDPADTLDLAEVAGRVLDPDDAFVAGLRERVAGAALLVVATPAYKAAPTGLLKAFLDGVEAGGLRRTVTVPVVLAAAPGHAALADLQLRVVLDALGARLPVPSLVVEQGRVDQVSDLVDDWSERHLAVLRAVRDTLRVPAVAS